MRLVKIKAIDGTIIVTCLTDRPPTEEIKELVAQAATEIIADFPTADLKEIVEEDNGRLPRENIISNGWIYLRYEGEDVL